MLYKWLRYDAGHIPPPASTGFALRRALSAYVGTGDLDIESQDESDQEPPDDDDHEVFEPADPGPPQGEDELSEQGAHDDVELPQEDPAEQGDSENSDAWVSALAQAIGSEGPEDDQSDAEGWDMILTGPDTQ